jgi:hypothetical protein
MGSRLTPSVFIVARFTAAYFVVKYKKALPLLSLTIVYNFSLDFKVK